MIDHTKRKTLKTIAFSGVGAAAAFSPLAFSNTRLPESGLSITHYGNFNGHTVLIRNLTNQPISLTDISPTQIDTPTGELDLSKLFEKGTLTVPANSTQAVSITHSGNTERYALWRHIGNSKRTINTTNRYHSVEVAGHYDVSGEPTTRQSHIAVIA